VVTGLATTIPAHLRIIETPQFLAGTHHTKLVEEQLDFSDLAAATAPTLPEEEETEERTITVEVGGRRYGVRYWAPVLGPAAGSSQRLAPRRRPPKLERTAGGGGGAGVVTAPMQGTIVKVHHAAGASVSAGDSLCVLEAMKMENELKAPIDGEIVDLRVQPGDAVSAGAVIMVIR
jgi:acetyl-CoA/propionyl-CoA carboxylase biotin carboxyl carrier protein